MFGLRNPAKNRRRANERQERINPAMQSLIDKTIS